MVFCQSCRGLHVLFKLCETGSGFQNTEMRFTREFTTKLIIVHLLKNTDIGKGSNEYMLVHLIMRGSFHLKIHTHLLNAIAQKHRLCKITSICNHHISNQYKKHIYYSVMISNNIFFSRFPIDFFINYDLIYTLYCLK